MMVRYLWGWYYLSQWCYATPPKRSAIQAQSNWIVQLFACLAFGALALVIGASIAYNVFYPPVWTERLATLNATGQALAITDHRYATDVSYRELIAFLANDTTIMANYSYPNYTCGDFAIHLHDDAEAQGIRSGIVAVSLNTTGYTGLDTSHAVRANPGVANDSDYGHGFNVFNTTDKGLVYIDATGVTADEKAQGRQPHYMVVYFGQGMPLGEIAVEQAESLNYSYYQHRERQYRAYELNLSAFNAEAQVYNAEILAFNNTSKALDHDQALFNEEYGRFSTELNDLRDANVSGQNMQDQLESWRGGLVEWLNALNIKRDKIREQNNKLDAEKQLLDEKRAAIEQSDVSKWTMTEPLGIVDKIDVFW